MVLVSLSSLAVPADALAAPHPAFLAGFLCRTRETRFEMAVQIQLSWFPRSSFLRSVLQLAAGACLLCLVALSPQLQICSPLTSGFRLDKSHWPCGPNLSVLSLPRVLWLSSFTESCHLTRVPLLLHHLARFDRGCHRDSARHTAPSAS